MNKVLLPIGRSLLWACLLTGLPAAAQEPPRDLTLDEIFLSERFKTQDIYLPQWVDGRGTLTYLQADSATGRLTLNAFTYADGRHTTLIAPAQITPRPGAEPLLLGSYQWFPGSDSILITELALSQRGTTAGGSIGVYTPSNGAFRLLADGSSGQSVTQLSPDGTMVGFVRGNNLYVMDTDSGSVTQLTTDGSPDILNGAFDWVYEEEFHVRLGWQWSPDSRRIAFWRLDQSHVPYFPLVSYTPNDPHAPVGWMRYPKAGDSLAVATIGIVDLRSRSTVWARLGPDTNRYVPRILWTENSDTLCIETLNRAQDTLQLLLCSAGDGSTRTLFRETDSAWVGVHDDLRFLRRSENVLWSSRRDGFNHLYLFDREGGLIRQLTRGPWDVRSVVGVNERRGLVYFTAARPSPLETQLYSVGLDGTGLRKISREAGEHAVQFSPDFLTYMDTHSSVSRPPRVSLRTNDGALVGEVFSNDQRMLTGYRAGRHRFFSFETRDSTLLNGWMLTPTALDTTKRYPVLMYVYGGPGSQRVLNRWDGLRGLWHRMLADQGIIVVCVDGRGTGGRGRAFMTGVVHRLGILEEADQAEAAQYLKHLPFVDSTRVGIWGWSYGGYMTCMAMTMSPAVFKTGVAVAPVTDWRYYDAIYTERYMKTPQSNPEGYRISSPLLRASDLEGTLLTIHGTTDDNVHWQNTILFVDALIRANKAVRTMFYPGRNHDLSGENVTHHLYSRITQFLRETL